MSITELYKHFLNSTGICTDSRNVEPGRVFFALKGKTFNGNEHAISALEKGCAMAVIDEDPEKYLEGLIKVNNVLECLQELATHHRRVVDPYIVGITGSNGKTTTKELLLAVISQQKRTHATKGNFNNHIGVPLTLLSMPKNTEVAIIEMGANHVGEIADLCQICDPDLGIITNIGKAHLEGFGSYKGVVRAKSELYDFIKGKEGELLVCSDNDLLMELSTGIKRTTYGINQGADLIGKCVSEIPFLEVEWTNNSKTAGGNVNSNVSGLHNLENILCAICAGEKLGIGSELISSGIKAHTPSDNRSQWITTKNNRIFLDAYNANPNSMELAIQNFVKHKHEHQLLILGDMKELGDTSKEEHKRILELVESLGKDVIYVGPEFEKVISNEKHYQNVADLISWIAPKLLSGKQILIKGSRGIALEQIVEFL